MDRHTETAVFKLVDPHHRTYGFFAIGIGNDEIAGHVKLLADLVMRCGSAKVYSGSRDIKRSAIVGRCTCIQRPYAHELRQASSGRHPAFYDFVLH